MNELQKFSPSTRGFAWPKYKVQETFLQNSEIGRYFIEMTKKNKQFGLGGIEKYY